MKYALLSLFTLLTVITVVTGCSSKLPADLPKLYPCTIELVAKGSGEPIAEASVSFSPVGEGQKWAAVALTDASGKGTVKTNGSYSGIAVGTYKILLTKTEVYVPSGVKETIDRDGTRHGAVERPVIPDLYNDFEKTPLECTIEQKEQTIRFEVPILTK